MEGDEEIYIYMKMSNVGWYYTNQFPLCNICLVHTRLGEGLEIFLSQTFFEAKETCWHKWYNLVMRKFYIYVFMKMSKVGW